MYMNVVEIAAHSVTCLFGVFLVRVVTSYYRASSTSNGNND
jgi:hypothetical protein